MAWKKDRFHDTSTIRVGPGRFLRNWKKSSFKRNMRGITVEVAITPLVFDDRRSTGALEYRLELLPPSLQISQYFSISNHGHHCMLQNLCLEFSVIPAFQWAIGTFYLDSLPSFYFAMTVLIVSGTSSSESGRHEWEFNYNLQIKGLKASFDQSRNPLAFMSWPDCLPERCLLLPMLLLDFIYLNEALPVNAQVPPLKPLYLTSSGERK